MWRGEETHEEKWSRMARYYYQSPFVCVDSKVVFFKRKKELWNCGVVELWNCGIFDFFQEKKQKIMVNLHGTTLAGQWHWQRGESRTGPIRWWTGKKIHNRWKHGNMKWNSRKKNQMNFEISQGNRQSKAPELKQWQATWAKRSCSRQPQAEFAPCDSP